MNTLQTLKKKAKSKKGFTLMEMLIVVAIIAILIAIAAPTFASALTKAKAVADEANIRSAQNVALVAYSDSTNHTGIAWAEDNKGNPYQLQTTVEWDGKKLAKGKYIKVEVTDDAAGKTQIKVSAETSAPTP